MVRRLASLASMAGWLLIGFAALAADLPVPAPSPNAVKARGTTDSAGQGPGSTTPGPLGAAAGAALPPDKQVAPKGPLGPDPMALRIPRGTLSQGSSPSGTLPGLRSRRPAPPPSD